MQKVQSDLYHENTSRIWRLDLESNITFCNMVGIVWPHFHCERMSNQFLGPQTARMRKLCALEWFGSCRPRAVGFENCNTDDPAGFHLLQWVCFSTALFLMLTVRADICS